MTSTRNGILLALLLLLAGVTPARAGGVPRWLPRYDLEIRLGLNELGDAATKQRMIVDQ